MAINAAEEAQPERGGDPGSKTMEMRYKVMRPDSESDGGNLLDQILPYVPSQKQEMAFIVSQAIRNWPFP